MNDTQILVVEDENIVALDIQSRLISLGYRVLGIASSGEEAMRKVEELRPSLVLMDIKLKGEMDGVEAAGRIRAHYDVPVIYLTAFADEPTLQRARITEPFGYILKPFEERELHTAIQMALYKHGMERKLRESEERFRSLIENVTDLIQVLDADGNIRYVSPSVKWLLGYESEEVIGRNVTEFLHPDDVPEAKTRLAAIVRDGATLRSQETRFRHKDGTWRVLEALGNDRLDDPAVAGVVVNLRDVTERVQAEQALRERERFLMLVNDITHAALETPDLDTMLQTLADRLGEVFGADDCFITLWDEVTQRVISGASYRFSRDDHTSVNVEPSGLAFTESVLQAGHPLVVEDAFDSPYLSRHIAEKHRYRSLLGLPLIAGDQKLGAAIIASADSHAFSSEEIVRGEQIATHTALGIAKVQILENEREQRLMAETLAEVTLALTSQTNDAAVLDEILRQAQRIVPHRTANIALLEGDVLRTVRRRGYEDYADEETMADLIQLVSQWETNKEVVQSKRPLVIPDTQRDARWLTRQETKWIRSYLAVPLCLRDRVLGLLRLDSDLPDRFSAQDAQRLLPLASAAAIAIENARLLVETRQRADELEALRRSSLQITSLLDLPAVLDTIAQSALGLVGGTDCHIYLYDAAREVFSFGAALWHDGRQEPAVAAPRPDGFTAAVVRKEHSIVINDAVHHPLFSTPEAEAWNVQAIAGFPLKQADRVVGVFTVAFLEPHTFSEDELRVLELLADQAVIAIQNARLVEGLEAEVAARTAEIVAEKETSEAILNSVGDAIIMADRERRIRYVNPAFSAMTGYSLEEIVGQEVAAVGATVDSELAERYIQRIAAEGRIWRGEATGRRKDGRTYDAALTIAPVRDTAGQLMGYVSSHRDISRIKEFDRARGRFITNVSHQLRTPVANIKLYAKLLRMGQRPEKTKDYVQVLEDQADQLSHLIQDILEITALDSGQGVIAWERVSVSKIVHGAMKAFMDRAKDSELTLKSISVSPVSAAVNGDLARLGQALGELIENAIIFTPAGGQVVVEENIVEEGGQRWAIIAVRDTGPGIPQEEQKSIFDRFFRGELVESGHIFGTGLGLSIVDEIIRAHGGRVTVESVVGEGSTFSVWLPLVQD